MTFEIEWVNQDIRPQMRYRFACIADQLHDGRGEANRDDIVETEHRGGAPLGQAPALPHSVEVPGAGHPHVRMQRQPSFELHHEVFAVWLDRLEAPSLQSRDRWRTSVGDHLAADALPQGGSRSPDRVALRQGPAGAPARGRRPSVSCRTRFRAASPPATSL